MDEVRFNFGFIIAVIGISILTILYILGMYWVGFHNIDLSYNACLMANYYDTDFLKLIDVGSSGIEIPVVELYSIGINQMLFSILPFFLLSILLGFCLARLIQLYEKKTD